MPRPKSKPGAIRSKMVCVRLRAEEEAGLKQLAADLGQPPSRIIRRLIREALTGGPDYFDDGVLDLRRMHRELGAIGRNLNQLSRVANQGGVVGGEDVRRVINAGIVQMEAVKELSERPVWALTTTRPRRALSRPGQKKRISDDVTIRRVEIGP